MEKRYALPCGLFSHYHTSCSIELPKARFTCVFIQWGTRRHMLKYLWCAAAVTNCRKNNLASWFAGIGGCSILHADVNDVEQMRQEGMPPTLPFTFLPVTRTSARMHTHIVAVCRLHYIRCRHQVLLHNKVELNVVLLSDPLCGGRLWVWVRDCTMGRGLDTVCYFVENLTIENDWTHFKGYFL